MAVTPNLSKPRERKRNGHEEERVAEKQVSFSADRRENQGARRLAGQDAQPAPYLSQGSRSRSRRRVEVERGSGVVARRHHLHWRILQECREAYLLQGRVSEGSGPSLQLESRRKRTPRDRHPRRRRSWRVRLQDARSPSGRPQQFWQ